tara:strand:- start:9418 stop:9711 length:294 start_codon:yes stop_codon:yes gene_type:complete
MLAGPNLSVLPVPPQSEQWRRATVRMTRPPTLSTVTMAVWPSPPHRPQQTAQGLAWAGGERLTHRGQRSCVDQGNGAVRWQRAQMPAQVHSLCAPTP